MTEAWRGGSQAPAPGLLAPPRPPDIEAVTGRKFRRHDIVVGAVFLLPALVVLGAVVVYPDLLHRRSESLRPTRRHVRRARQLPGHVRETADAPRHPQHDHLGRRRPASWRRPSASSSPCSPSGSVWAPRSRVSSSCRWRSPSSPPGSSSGSSTRRTRPAGSPTPCPPEWRASGTTTGSYQGARLADPEGFVSLDPGFRSRNPVPLGEPVTVGLVGMRPDRLPGDPAPAAAPADVPARRPRRHRVARLLVRAGREASSTRARSVFPTSPSPPSRRAARSTARTNGGSGRVLRPGRAGPGRELSPRPRWLQLRRAVAGGPLAGNRERHSHRAGDGDDRRSSSPSSGSGPASP